MSQKGSTKLLDFIENFYQDFCLPSSKWQTLCIEKSMEEANNFQNFVILALDDTKMVKKSFKSILHYVEQTIWEPWSDRQHEFVVLTCYEDEAFNIITCLSVLSALAFKEGDTASLEEIQRIVVRHQHHSGAGFVMNNLGVMFSENSMYKKSEKCFNIAKSYFERTLCKQDNQRDACAVVTLNLAVLCRALGDYQKAQDLCDDAASLCHDISMRERKDAHLAAKLLRRVSDMLEEFGNYKSFYKILGIGVHYDIGGGDKADVVGLTKRLMKIQLKGETGEKIQAKEVGDFASNLFALLEKPAAEFLNAEVMKTVIITAKIYRNIGHHEEACNLLKKLRNTFLMVHGGKSSLYGSLHYQIGCFLLGSGKFGEAESVLKQAEEILICHFGRSHYAVASCKNFLGSCVLLKGNTKEALKHLNEGLALFRKLNPNHPEVGEILLKLAFFYAKEGNIQCAHETLQEGMGILISACGEVSTKTANGYIQSAMVLLKVEVLRSLAEEKLMKAIDIFISLGLSPNHSDVMVCHSLLGVLQLSLRKYEEAEKCFGHIQQQVSLSDEPGIKARILTPPRAPLTAGHSQDRFSYLCAKIVSLVNLVHMKTGDERHNHLDTLVSCLEECKTGELQIWDFASQDVFYFSHRLPVSEKPVVCILYSDPKPVPSESNEGLNSDLVSDSRSDMFLSSSVKNTYVVLFLRIPHTGREGVKSLASAFRTSMNTLSLQPMFKKCFLEGKVFYMKLTVPADLCVISFLCKQIDCLPLLVELELSESQEQCDNFDYLTSWGSSVKSAKPAVHVFYFSFKCANQRKAEFVFDQVIHSLVQRLALNKVQDVVSNICPVQNVASFFFHEPRYSSLSVVVENKLVIVKCCSLKHSDLNCVSFLVRSALESTMESLCDVVRVNFEQSEQLPCKDVGTGGCVKESSSENCSLDVNSDPSCSGLPLGTEYLIPCASSGDLKSDLKRKPTVDLLQDENVEVNPTVSHPGDNFHADVDVCLCLLSCLLNQSRSVSAREEASNSCAVSTSSTSGYDSDNNHIQVNKDHSISSSPNLHPVTPSASPESGEPFTQEKSSSDSMLSVSKMKGHNQNSFADQNDLEISMYRDFSSHEEVLIMIEGCPDPETMKTKHLEDLGQLQTSSTEVNEEESFIFTVDNKGICKRDTKSSIVNDSELPSSKWHEDLYVNQNQHQNLSVEFPQSVQGPSSAASSEKTDTGTLTDDCLRPLLANLEDELSAFQKGHLELQQQISHLEEQLRQSEGEKQNLQACLGKYQFLEDKEKRRERLLGGAAPVQDPGFSLHARLLEISNSLSAEEVKRIKFLAKRKVSSFRLARFTEAFELFEELEVSGEFPCDYIGKLLAGIQRYDLVEKLGIHVPLPGAERGLEHPPEQIIPDRKHELPDQTQSMPTQDNSMDVNMSRTKETDYCNQYASISSSESSDETSSDMPVLSLNAESDVSFLQSTANAKEYTWLPNYSDDGFLSVSSRSTSSSDSLVNSTQTTQAAASNCTSLASSDSTDGSPLLTTVNSHSVFGSNNISSNNISSNSDLTPTSSEEENLRSSQMLANGGEESEEREINSTHTSQAAASNCTSQASSESTDGSPLLTTVNSHSAFGSNKIYSDGDLSPTSSEEENLRSSQMLANGSEESEDKDVCDGAVRTASLHTSTCAVNTGTISSDSSTCGFVKTQSGANVGNIPWSQQGAFPSAEMAAGGAHSSSVFSGTTTDWERLGARPKQGRVQQSVIKQMPGEPFISVTDGLAGDFLARHTQDKALHDSLYQSVGTEMPLFNDTPAQGASYIDGAINISDSNKAKPYLGDCQAAFGTDPYSRLGASGGRFDGRDISYSEHLSNNTGPSPSHLGGNYFSVYGNYSQRNASDATNGLLFHSGFVHNNSRFSEHVGRAPYLPLETQQGPYPSVPSNQFVNSGVTDSSFADLSWNGTTVGTQSELPVNGAQRYTSFNNNTSALISSHSVRQTPKNTNVALGNYSSGTANNENEPSASARNILHEHVQNSALPTAHTVSSCDPTRTTGLDSTTTSWPSLICHSSNTTTVGDRISAQGSASGTTIHEPSCGNTDSSRASVLNNRDFGTDSVESTDNSLLALEQRVAEACALVERVLREREEREQFGREIERKEQLIREQRARERREREEREIQEAERWPQQQEAITARSQWLCEHYQRHCRVRFPCCTQYYPCHRCHNISKACDNEEAKACHASHLKCSHCQHEQEIGEDSEKCRKCGGKMSAYFCPICKHFTSNDKNPYHCEKCGICRIHKDKSFHCEVCNVCLDKRLQGNHKCRPDSGHDECCICLEDAFSGCQILPCSHKVHRECAIAMIQNGIRTCPICRHPLYSPPRE